MIRPRQRWIHRPGVQSTLARLLAGYIRLLERTGRFEVRCPRATVELVRAGRPFIGAFWHGRLLMMLPAWQMLQRAFDIRSLRQTHVIGSNHGDGRLIRLTVSHFGVGTVVGSSRHGGSQALRQARRILEDGDIVIMTPDGPRGPRMHAHKGVAYLASKMAVPVVPATFAATPQRRLRSWDSFVLVLPFAKGIVAFGDPIYLPVSSSLDVGRRLIESEMNRISAEIDRAVGLDPIRPDG